MKLRLIAATLAVMALGTTSIMAEGLKGMPETPLAIVESQKDSASILPDQYKSYACLLYTSWVVSVLFSALRRAIPLSASPEKLW